MFRDNNTASTIIYYIQETGRRAPAPLRRLLLAAAPPHRVGLSVRGEMRIAAMIRDREFSILNSPNQCVRFCMFFIYLFFLRFHLLPSIQVGRENAREGSLDNSCPPLRGRAGGGGGEGGGTRIRVQTACTDSIRRFCEISKRV